MIQECDLTKREIPEGEDLVTVIIKKDGKRTGRTYELSASAAAKLEQQLIAGKECILAENWSFGSSSSPIIEKRKLADFDVQEDIEEEEILEIEDKISAKKKEIEDGEEEFIPAPAIKNGCRHLNKGRIQTTLKDGKRFVYRLCVECRNRVPEITSQERTDYMNGKPPSDVNIRDYER